MRSPHWSEFLTRLILGLLSAILLMLLSTGPAQAVVVHRFQLTFGEPGSGPGQLREPTSVAVNDSTSLVSPAAGDVYVVDRGNDRVERFSASGGYLGQFEAPPGGFAELGEVAVDNSNDSVSDPSSEDVYVIDQGNEARGMDGVIDKFSSTGSYIGQITGTKVGKFDVGKAGKRSLTGIAVDPAGTVWAETRGDPIYGFTDALVNQEVAELGTVFGGGVQLQVDAEDNFVFNTGNIEFVKVSSSGKVLSNPFGGDKEAYVGALDPFHGEVYLSDGYDEIQAFDLEGNPIESDRVGALAPSFGAGHVASLGLGVNDANATVYASNFFSGTVSIFEAVTLPTVRLASPTGQQPRTVTLNGTVNPEGKAVTECAFEYDTSPYSQGEAAHGTSIPCSPGVSGSGTSPVAVSASVTGLTPEHTYYYRLVAKNEAGRVTTGGQEFFTGPVLAGEFITAVTSSSATLHAQIDPNGSDTHYYFEYGTTTAYGTEVPVAAPGVDIGSLKEVQNISLHIQGLKPSTSYHYRLVVSQGGEAFEEPDGTFTTQTGDGEGLVLPDGRVWELVSPADKKAALITPGESGRYWLTQAAEDGSGITYTVNESLGEGTIGHIFTAQALSRRTTYGWRTQNVSGRGGLTPEGESTGSLFGADEYWTLFSSDLSLGVLEQGAAPTVQTPEAIRRTLYIRSSSTGVFNPLETKTGVPAAALNGSEPPYYYAATPNLSYVLFGSYYALTPASESAPAAVEEPCRESCDLGEDMNIYEWHEGQLQLVNVFPNGTTKPFAWAGNALMNTPKGEMIAKSISDDGRFVVWHFGELFQHKMNNLFVRDMVEGRTMKIGGPQARFETMSDDGSKIFYVETEEIQDKGANGDLYVFNTATDTEKDLTADHGAGEKSAGVQNAVLGASGDGSYIYFVARGVLATGAVGGRDNLYVAHEAEGRWTTTFIASLSQEDEQTWGGDSGREGAHEDPWEVDSEVSPNGRYVAFMSNSPLTGYDNRDAVSGQRDEEVFLYDATSNKLVCASCNPTDARPAGVFDDGKEDLLADSQLAWSHHGSSGEDHWLAGSLVGWNNTKNRASYKPRYMMDDGRLFFDSPDALVPQDTNGFEDVYEYEPPGVGNCAQEGAGYSPVAEGCVNLITSGQASAESVFMDASETGDDVFFVTPQKLVGGDYDNTYDMYDAHVCGAAVPCNVPPASPPECTSGDSCKAAPSPQPTLFGPAPSATFKGIGNISPQASRPVVESKPPSRAKQLANALRACRRKKVKRKRVSCERQAKRHYRAAKTGRARKSSGRGNR